MKIKERLEAKRLRKQGYSLSEISDVLGVSKSSASLWVRDIKLSPKAKKVLASKSYFAQLASRNTKRQQRVLREKEAKKVAINTLKNLNLEGSDKKIICAIMYYCEGNKRLQDGVRFTNSDPLLVTTFLKLFRTSFDLDEKRFRVCVHLHDYHDKDHQLMFWSKTAKIPLSQFIKPYQKKSSGLYKKEGYQGCVNIRYSDVRVARELTAIALEFMSKQGL